ncbi:hypothetical protein Dret_0362 [Desulfohalobium retbaense DSM 5692]|uniref:Uncharacterized protein n=1 Tax=Desulfohalobium retbaense (strain ATCC 49708 / DSM 5692 / JCM 16813 / HR100) TaxID=485915 RepID=C8X039_DESRD|nr:hypothetical protein Dret_0362 [Desulfohalobium retbaense DSM 5692]
MRSRDEAVPAEGKTRWPGGAPLTARSVHTLQFFFRFVLCHLAVSKPLAKASQVPCGTSSSNREWVMNEAPLTAATVRRGEWLLSRMSSDCKERAVKYLLPSARKRFQPPVCLALGPRATRNCILSFAQGRVWPGSQLRWPSLYSNYRGIYLNKLPDRSF